LLFPGYGRADRGEAFEVDEFLNVIASCVAVGVCFVLVFCYADFDLGCHSDVEFMEVAGEDVDVCDLVHALKYRRSGLWRTSNDKCKGEMQGSVHCAAHDRTVRRFGRDDASLGRVEFVKNSNGNSDSDREPQQQQQQQQRERERTSNRNHNSNGNSELATAAATTTTNK
jgi:hypothetical protein